MGPGFLPLLEPIRTPNDFESVPSSVVSPVVDGRNSVKQPFDIYEGSQSNIDWVIKLEVLVTGDDELSQALAGRLNGILCCRSRFGSGSQEFPSLGDILLLDVIGNVKLVHGFGLPDCLEMDKVRFCELGGRTTFVGSDVQLSRVRGKLAAEVHQAAGASGFLISLNLFILWEEGIGKGEVGTRPSAGRVNFDERTETSIPERGSEVSI